MTLLEISANAFNLCSVYLAYRNSIHTWWIGIIGTSLFAFLFFDVKLYADVTLQGFFILTSIFGWYNWLFTGHGREELPITVARPAELSVYIGLSVLVYLAYSFLLIRFTDASYPLVDSIVLVASVTAQLLLMKRKLETWLFWIVVDLVAVPLFLSKELYLTASIYFLFLINAVLGFRNWTKIYRTQNEAI